MGWNKQVRLSLQNSIQARFDFPDASTEAPVIPPHSREPLLKTVDFPDTPGPIDQVACKRHPLAIHLYQISHRSVSVARCIDDFKSQTLPFMNISTANSASYRDRISKGEKVRPEIVTMVQDTIGRIPKLTGRCKKMLLSRRNDYLGARGRQL